MAAAGGQDAERGQVADRGPTAMLSQRVALLQQRLGIRRDVVTTRAPYQLCRVVFDHA